MAHAYRKLPTFIHIFCVSIQSFFTTCPIASFSTQLRITYLYLSRSFYHVNLFTRPSVHKLTENTTFFVYFMQCYDRDLTVLIFDEDAENLRPSLGKGILWPTGIPLVVDLLIAFSN